MDADVLDQLKELLPFLIPLLIIQYALVIAALIDLVRREKTNGPKWMWALVIILVNFIGPIVYFFAGRDE
jgi:hypothetical protein